VQIADFNFLFVMLSNFIDDKIDIALFGSEAFL